MLVVLIDLELRERWLGTNLAGHSTGALVTKVKGNYNIIDNVLNFTEASIWKYTFK